MPMRESDLKVILQAEKTDALSAQTASKLSADRERAMDYYLGDMSDDMPVPEGRSQAVSTDVADTIEGLMPSFMEIFASGDEVVSFEPLGADDIERAQQETEFVNYVFTQLNDGFVILYTLIKDALLSKVGVVKVWPEKKESEERESYFDQTDDAIGVTMEDPNVEIVERTEKPQADGSMLYDFTVSSKRETVIARVEPVPPEEFGISRNAKNVRDSNYCFHETKPTEGDLIADGYDEAQIKALASYAAAESSEESSRDTVEESTATQGDAGLNTTNRLIRVTEHYIRMDYEQNGKPCLYRVTTGGEDSVVLKRNGKPDIEKIDLMPFAAMTPVIVPHRFIGRAIADLVMDIQRIKTALLRAMLDNAYLSNNPRTIGRQYAGRSSRLASRRHRAGQESGRGRNLQASGYAERHSADHGISGRDTRMANGCNTAGAGHRRQCSPEPECYRSQSGIYGGPSPDEIDCAYLRGDWREGFVHAASCDDQEIWQGFADGALAEQVGDG
jgi:hypothetical protein